MAIGKPGRREWAMKVRGTPMTRDQRTVLAGALAGIAAMLLAMWLLCTLLPAPGLPTLAERLA